MSIIEIIFIGISLAMDAFAVSICKGLSVKKMSYKNAIKCGLYFGIFQALMPLLGFLLGSTFKNIIEQIDHWIAFILLLIIGINMIKEAFDNDDKNKNDDMSFKTMLMLAIATSIDALAVGITFSFLEVNILMAIIIIGVITFIISFAGVAIGNIFGSKYENKAKIFGGVVLILIGLKILLEHLNIINL